MISPSHPRTRAILRHIGKQRDTIMYEKVKVLERRTTWRKIATYLVLISTSGTIEIFLVGAIVTSRYFEFLNRGSNHEFWQLHTLGETAAVTILGAVGVVLTFVANKLADELWDMLRNHKKTIL